LNSADGGAGTSVEAGADGLARFAARLCVSTGVGFAATAGVVVAPATASALATLLGTGATAFAAGCRLPFAIGGADTGPWATLATGARAAQNVNPEATSAEPSAAHSATRLDVFFTARSSLASTTLRSPHIATPRVEATFSASAVVGARVLVGTARTARAGKREGTGGTGVS